jgi:CheY-like chemotaxis protein
MLTRDTFPAVMVVDDHAALRRLVVRYLRSDGIEAFHVGTAAPALSMARQHAGLVQLAIIDMNLPDMNGFDLAALLGREYPALKFLYISGYVDSMAMQGAARVSPHVVLFKPFTGRALLDKVHMLLDMPQKLGPARAAQECPSSSRTGTQG